MAKAAVLGGPGASEGFDHGAVQSGLLPKGVAEVEAEGLVFLPVVHEDGPVFPRVFRALVGG